jgi:hypothetical protein
VAPERIRNGTEEGVTREMPFDVVHGLEPVHVDESADEPAFTLSAGPFHLALQLLKPDAPAPCARQVIGARELSVIPGVGAISTGVLSVALGVLPVAIRVFAVAACVLAVTACVLAVLLRVLAIAACLVAVIPSVYAVVQRVLAIAARVLAVIPSVLTILACPRPVSRSACSTRTTPDPQLLHLPRVRVGQVVTLVKVGGLPVVPLGDPIALAGGDIPPQRGLVAI